ncbi:unnamed protein product [Absidia cylindrospora]
MEDKFLTFDYTKPEENERRKAEMEQHRWAQKMTKTNGADKPGMPPATRGNSRTVVAGTYNTSVVDYINQQPATPLSASDILKLEELERIKRTQQSAHHISAQQNQLQQQHRHHHHQRHGVARDKSRTQDWRPPSGIMVSNTSLIDPDPLNAIQARDDYILQAGGVPPPVNPPPPSMATPSSDRTIGNNNNSVDHRHLGKEQRHEKQQQHHRRRSSSESSYQIAPSPENLHRPLMATSTSSIVTNLTTNTNNQQQRSRTDPPVPPQKWMFDANTLPPIPPSTASSPLPPPSMPPPPIPLGLSPPRKH